MHSHEVLERRIVGLVGKKAAIANEIPMQPWWNGFNTSGKKIVQRAAGEGGNIEVGYAGNRRRLGGIASRGEHVYWVTDNSVKPPITYILHDTMMGAFVNVGNAMVEKPDSKDNVYSEQGSVVVTEMQELLDRFIPAVIPREPIQLNFSAAPVPGIGV